MSTYHFVQKNYTPRKQNYDPSNTVSYLCKYATQDGSWPLLQNGVRGMSNIGNTVEPGYKRTGYRRNLVIRDKNAATKFSYTIKPGYRRNWL